MQAIEYDDIGIQKERNVACGSFIQMRIDTRFHEYMNHEIRIERGLQYIPDYSRGCHNMNLPIIIVLLATCTIQADKECAKNEYSGENLIHRVFHIDFLDKNITIYQ